MHFDKTLKANFLFCDNLCLRSHPSCGPHFVLVCGPVAQCMALGVAGCYHFKLNEGL